MSSYLADRRRQLGLTMKQVAQAVGVSEATISRWESGQIANMKRDKIAAYAKALDVKPAFIMTGEADNSLPANATPYNPTHRIPILGRVSAGLPLYAEQHIEGYTFTDLNHGGEYFALRVEGDSMTAARINDGDLVIVRRQDIVENGELAVVLVDDDFATIKRYSRSGDTVVLTPQSYNPEHSPQIYNLKNTRIKILGKVVEIIISL